MAPVDVFTWGRVMDRFEYDFDGQLLEVVKHHPWKVSDGCRVLTGNPDMDVVEYHCHELRAGFYSIEALLVSWLAYKKLGNNQHALASGICRALDIQENPSRPGGGA